MDVQKISQVIRILLKKRIARTATVLGTVLLGFGSTSFSIAQDLQADRSTRLMDYYRSNVDETPGSYGAFVSEVFAKVFQLDVPTEARELLSVGTLVRTSSVVRIDGLEPGDVIFIIDPRDQVLDIGIYVDPKNVMGGNLIDGVWLVDPQVIMQQRHMIRRFTSVILKPVNLDITWSGLALGMSLGDVKKKHKIVCTRPIRRNIGCKIRPGEREQSIQAEFVNHRLVSFTVELVSGSHADLAREIELRIGRAPDVHDKIVVPLGPYIGEWLESSAWRDCKRAGDCLSDIDALTLRLGGRLQALVTILSVGRDPPTLSVINAAGLSPSREAAAQTLSFEMVRLATPWDKKPTKSILPGDRYSDIRHQLVDCQPQTDPNWTSCRLAIGAKGSEIIAERIALWRGQVVTVESVLGRISGAKAICFALAKIYLAHGGVQSTEDGYVGWFMTVVEDGRRVFKSALVYNSVLNQCYTKEYTDISWSEPQFQDFLKWNYGGR